MTVIRLATPDDADGVNAVYNPFIERTAATLEVTPYDRARRLDWINRLAGSPRTPVFVAEVDGRVAGFANAAPFDPREAYARSVKTSVYIAPAFTGLGLGRRLYAALFERLSDSDVHRAYAIIAPPNPISVALHERFGFRHVATLNQVGFKLGEWRDVMWFEKRLA